ncbi:MAG: hypothetical protein F2621_01150 [Actinobacteria bacterium]|uniref:Unannotated protein n=1 Tax=freshwater metagenome TaxID=449393 RepID=A0A6J6JLE8_9ZZZZ|nr:hypothetical protein [Actinomycetota bacterium]MTA32380.1 hypothetical protein [Actinomycetota bacterium]
MAKLLINVVPVWAITAIGVGLVGFLVSEDNRVASMVAVLAGSLLMAFILQVGAYQSEGLVRRLSWATTGSALLTALAAVVFQVLSVVD